MSVSVCVKERERDNVCVCVCVCVENVSAFVKLLPLSMSARQVDINGLAAALSIKV